jgi:hypothetical protein
MKPLPVLGLLLAVTTAMNEARADDDRAKCFDAAEKGQQLREAHKLVEARDEFRVCAAAACPATVRGDCTGWLDQADKAIPTVVPSAKDAAGNDVFDVTVTMDGVPFATRLEGVAQAVDPGPHTFRFRWPDGVAKERQVLVVEGQKALVVAVSLAPAGGASPPPPPPPLPPPPLLPQSSGGPPWHTIGWIVGGVGVAGLGLGLAFTGVTLSDKSSAGCDAATKKCTNYGSITSAMNAAPVAGTGLIGGGALVVTGALLLLLTHPSKEAPPAGQTVSFAVAPMATGQGGGALLEGAW